MKYRTRFANQFGIVLDDVTLTWQSEPPGRDLPGACTLRFTRDGSGPGEAPKEFTLLPGGRVRLFKSMRRSS